MRRVVVTGLGVISPVGNSVEEYWNNLINGNSGITYIPEDRFPTENLEAKIGGVVDNFDLVDYDLKLDEREKRTLKKRLDPVSQYAVAAAHQALNDGKIGVEEDNDVGAIIGIGMAGLTTWEEQFTNFKDRGPNRVSPITTPGLMPNAPAANISITYNLKGPAYGVVSACAAGTHAIIDAYKHVRDGDADIVFTGGAEATLTGFCFSTFYNMQAMIKDDAVRHIAEALNVPESPEIASRPFDALRAGFVMGEGAGIVILEDLEHAESRKADIYAEMVGYGFSADARHITESDVLGPAKAMKMAMKKAGVSPEQVDYINAHGTSTKLNDLAETEAVKAAFGEYASKVAISSTKSMTGHLLGGAGGIEAVAAILAIKHGKIPPTINLKRPDPECDLDYVPNQAREKEVNCALSNSFGFGGHNAVVIFRRY